MIIRLRKKLCMSLSLGLTVRNERDIKNRVVFRVFFVFLYLFVQCFTTPWEILHLLNTPSKLHRGTHPGQPSQTRPDTPSLLNSQTPLSPPTQTSLTRPLGTTPTPNNKSPVPEKDQDSDQIQDPKPPDNTPHTHASHNPPTHNGAPHTRKRPPEDNPLSTSKKRKTVTTSGNGEW
jgi:hypothetical protein